MAMDDGEAGLALDLTLRQARTLVRDTPDGRISSLARRRLRDAAEQSPQGARLSVEIAALAGARRATAAADEMLHTAQTGARRIEQLLDELRSLAVEAAKDDRSDHERALLDARFTAAPTAGGDVRVAATTFSTLTLDATRPAGFRATVPAAGDTATGAYLGRRVTPLAFRVGTGTQPAADEVAVNLAGLTPGTLALQDVQLGTPRRAERATRLVGEATAELRRTLGEITGGRQRLAAAADAADQQRDGLIAAREALVDPEAAHPVNQRIAQRIVAELDIGIGLGGRRLPVNVYGPLFGRAG